MLVHVFLLLQLPILVNSWSKPYDNEDYYGKPNCYINNSQQSNSNDSNFLSPPSSSSYFRSNQLTKNTNFEGPLSSSGALSPTSTTRKFVYLEGFGSQGIREFFVNKNDENDENDDDLAIKELTRSIIHRYRNIRGNDSTTPRQSHLIGRLLGFSSSLSTYRHKVATLLTIAVFSTAVISQWPAMLQCFGSNRYLNCYNKNNIGVHCAWNCKQIFMFVYFLYLLEAFLCSTRRYLANMYSPKEVLDMIRNLQQSTPVLRWDLECYHHRASFKKGGHRDETTKLVTHRASKEYHYKEWSDKTQIGSLLNCLEYYFNEKNYYDGCDYLPYRSRSSSSFRPTDCNFQNPFIKISFAKILLFQNEESYQNYCSQEIDFKIREGFRDQYTDIRTSFEVGKGHYRNKIMAVKTSIGIHDHVRLTSFWLFTLLGFTVPYRSWLDKYCDDINVLIVKQVK